MENSFVDTVTEVFGGSLLGQDDLDPEEIELTHFQARVPKQDSIPSHVKIEVNFGDCVNPRNPGDVPKLTMLIIPSICKSDEYAALLLEMRLSTSLARHIAAELVEVADVVDRTML